MGKKGEKNNTGDISHPNIFGESAESEFIGDEQHQGCPETCTKEKIKFPCWPIDQVYEKLAQGRGFSVNRKGILLLHDNARPHVALETERRF